MSAGVPAVVLPGGETLASGSRSAGFKLSIPDASIDIPYATMNLADGSISVQVGDSVHVYMCPCVCLRVQDVMA